MDGMSLKSGRLADQLSSPKASEQRVGDRLDRLADAQVLSIQGDLNRWKVEPQRQAILRLLSGKAIAAGSSVVTFPAGTRNSGSFNLACLACPRATVPKQPNAIPVPNSIGNVHLGNGLGPACSHRCSLVAPAIFSPGDSEQQPIAKSPIIEAGIPVN